MLVTSTSGAFFYGPGIVFTTKHKSVMFERGRSVPAEDLLVNGILFDTWTADDNAKDNHEVINAIHEAYQRDDKTFDIGGFRRKSDNKGEENG